MTGACREFGWNPAFVIHDLPLAQLFAFSACAAWSAGLEPLEGSYEDREFERALDALKGQ
ncbi:MAG: hypothetical protein V4733_03785 [Verrucomicrobiota bacterium]